MFYITLRLTFNNYGVISSYQIHNLYLKGELEYNDDLQRFTHIHISCKYIERDGGIRIIFQQQKKHNKIVYNINNLSSIHRIYTILFEQLIVIFCIV